MSIFRIYVEKKQKFAVEATSVFNDVTTALKIDTLKDIRIINRYDAMNISEGDFASAITTVFSEPSVDNTYTSLPEPAKDETIFAVEYLPGQFDQRADSAAQCISLLTKCDRPMIRSAKIYILKGNLSDEDTSQIKSYLINPVESREASLDLPKTLDISHEAPEKISTFDGFIHATNNDLKLYIKEYGLAMDFDDIKFCQQYFKETEKRNPTITEIRMIDTYWSDHCRHTTFSTIIEDAEINTDYIKDTYNDYINTRDELYSGKDKPVTLMDLAVIGAKKLKAKGLLKELDESEEINACSVKIKVDVNGNDEDWLLMFKNETHNHPTEIEPFGGAATCLGGAIRDPLSGRSYVYQAMRVTGSANPLVPTEDTIPGKLPQRKITVTAANGYSSYGNQIGLATGHVSEVYHHGYMAKRMEIGAVVGAAPIENVVRETPLPGDIVILLGGKTGRDGCGGATGSSKSHTAESLESCGAEVQKGNAPEERKLQRLFRNKEVTQMIKRCNDFGAGGVSVAIGELTDGLIIDLDKVPKKYNGLDGTEIAISESQERMAVVIKKEDTGRFLAEAQKENLEATVVATVTDDKRLRMNWNSHEIVNLSREFLNSNGATKRTKIIISNPVMTFCKAPHDSEDTWYDNLSNLHICSQKGLIERFDSTIGANTVLMPFGGYRQMTPTQAMAAKLPVLHGDTTTCSIMSWGFNPHISEKSPYHGAILAVVESIAKIVAAGGNHKHCWLTFQEYFERTQNNPERWGKPLAALLGAYKAQCELSCAAIGGKDSMSGTFENIDVPPTLVSFAVSTGKSNEILSPEFKKAGSEVVLITPEYDNNGLPVFSSIISCFENVEKLISDKKAVSVWSVSTGGVSEGIAKMCFGNAFGFKFTKKLSSKDLYTPCYGSFIVELADGVQTDNEVIGTTTSTYAIETEKYTVSLDKLEKGWAEKLEPVFKTKANVKEKRVINYEYKATEHKAPAIKVAKPKVLIPVFPGTNCEYDTARAFIKAGADPEIFVIRNLTANAIEESVSLMQQKINESQIIMIPGGFSGGDEPDGSAKFITAFFRNSSIKDAVHNLLDNRDGLMLGICNGFQALIKLGLLTTGKIVDMTDDSPTLTFNTIARHQSMMVNTRIASNMSPWLMKTNVGDIHTVPISHGEGRFVADASLIAQLAKNGQIATQYVDQDNNATMSMPFNPNNSNDAIEGITSPDGRVFGKMGHSERYGTDICKNVAGNKDQHIFESGVQYFK